MALSLSAEEIHDRYLLRRLEYTTRARALPANMRFDLAASDMNDEDFEDAADAFSDNPASLNNGGASGWGFGRVLDDLMRREPKAIPSKDLENVQSFLAEQGYVHPDTEINGMWDSDWNAILNRAERDVHTKRIESGGPLGTPMESVFRFLGGVLPSAVFTGLVGGAKGMLAQAPETAERLGLVGGALTGAALGAPFGPVGVAVGGIGGAAVGFFADLFGDDETEGEDRSGWAQLFDALSPWEEYRPGKEGGFQRFSEDLGFILTAASFVSGGSAALGGVRAAGAGLRSGFGAGAAAPLRARIGLQAAERAKPGYITRVLASPKGAAVVGAGGGAATAMSQDADASGILIGAAAGGLAGYGFGKVAGSKVTELGRRYGLQRLYDMPLIKTMNRTFTGLSTASMGARYAGGLGSDGRTTEIEKAIKGAPALPGGDIIDLTFGSILTPERFFALKPFELAKSAERVLGPENEAWWALDMYLRRPDPITGKVPGVAERDHIIRTILGEGDPTNKTKQVRNMSRLLINFGIHQETGALSRQFDHLSTTEKLIERNKVHTDLILEWQNEMRLFREGKVNDLPVSRRLMEWSQGGNANAAEKGPGAFFGWLEEQGGYGVGLDRLPKLIQGETLGEDLMRYVERGDFSLGWTDQMVDAEDVINVLGPKKLRSQRVYPKERRELENEIDMLERKVKKVRGNALATSDELAEATEMQARATQLREEASKIKPIRLEGAFIPVRKADPELGIVDTPTAQDAYSLADDWERELGIATEASKRLQRGDLTDQQRMTVQTELQNALERLAHDPANQAEEVSAGLLHRMWRMDLISDPQFIEAKNALSTLRSEGKLKGKGAAVHKHLRNLADEGLLAHSVELPEELAARVPDGYRMVWTSQPRLRTSDFIDDLRVQGVDDFMERPYFWDTIRHGGWADMTAASRNSLKNVLRNLGGSPVKYTGEDIFAAYHASQAVEVHRALKDAGVDISGKQAMRLISKERETINHGHGKIVRRLDRPEEVVTSGRGILKREFRSAGETGRETRLWVGDEREMKQQDIVRALDLDLHAPDNVDPEKVAYEVMKALKRGRTFGAEVKLMQPITSAKMLAKSLQVDGLPGYLEFMRAFDVDRPRAFFGLGGAAAGALAAEGDLKAHLKGAAVGGAIGLGALGLAGKASGVKTPFRKLLQKSPFPQGSYGFLPDHLHRISMATRYTFSILFDLGRIVEQNMVALLREGQPVMIRPRKYIRAKYGERGVKDMERIMDDMRGGGLGQMTEEADRRMFQAGLAGYSPPETEAARAYLMWRDNPNISMGELRRRVLQLEGYGTGRRTIEKSVNFIFFPFSFQKKLLTTLGDFVLQEPARALLIHEGFRRFNEAEVGKDVSEFTEKYLPIASQLQRLNNLSYGVGPGRFFLQGLLDDPKGRRTDLGAAADILSRVGVPSAANVPLAQMFGGVGDALVHMFMPTVIAEGNEQGMTELVESLDTFIPALRDLNTLFAGAVPGFPSDQPGIVSRQFDAALKGGDPYWQAEHYADDRRMKKAELEDTALALGYSSAEGLLASDVGVTTGMKQRYDAELMKLQAKYPVGAQMAANFTNQTDLKAQTLRNILEKEDRSEAESAILRIAAIEQSTKNLASMMGVAQESLLRSTLPKIRAEAMRFIDDEDFVYLFERFFAIDYGPLTTTIGALNG